MDIEMRIRVEGGWKKNQHTHKTDNTKFKQP